MMASVDMMVIPPSAGLVVGKIWYFRDQAGVGCW
jgi:hypothetical protein